MKVKINPKYKKPLELETTNSLKNSFPQPKEVNCSQCNKNFFIKFVVSQQNYSKKNNWGYWTEDKKNQDQEWCSNCLRQIYYNKELYWQAVKNSKKRAIFRVYLSNNHI